MNWKDIVKSVAPVLGGALGGPFGGVAAKWMAGELLGDENAGDDVLENLITTASPDTMLKIKELDNQFERDMADIGLKKEQLHAGDRDSARKMAISTTLIPQIIISTIFMVAFSVILYTVFSETIDMSEQQKTIMNILLGILASGVTQVMNFWFGSSSGSKEKDALKVK